MSIHPDNAGGRGKRYSPEFRTEALDPVLEPYAETHYGYDLSNLVITMKSHGGIYTITLAYTPKFPGSSSLDVWISKTAVTYPDSSVRSFYVNRVQQLMLETWMDPSMRLLRCGTSSIRTSTRTAPG